MHFCELAARVEQSADGRGGEPLADERREQAAVLGRRANEGAGRLQPAGEGAFEERLLVDVPKDGIHRLLRRFGVDAAAPQPQQDAVAAAPTQCRLDARPAHRHAFVVDRAGEPQVLDGAVRDVVGAAALPQAQLDFSRREVAPGQPREGQRARGLHRGRGGVSHVTSRIA
jgi:hypothetical protein